MTGIQKTKLDLGLKKTIKFYEKEIPFNKHNN